MPDLVRQQLEIRALLVAVVFGAADGPLQLAEAFRGLLQQSLDISGNRLIAVDQRAAGTDLGLAGEPVFQLVEEAGLGLAGAQVEITQQQRAREAEQ